MEESKTVEPTFIQMGDDDFINLNTVKRIEFVKNKDKRIAVTFFFPDGTFISFKLKDYDSFKDTIKNVVPYYFSVETVT